MELAFLGYNSVVVAPRLDPPCKLAQSLESDTGEHQELMLHVGHVLEWCLFFDSLPLILVLPQIVEELGPQLLLICLCVGGVVVQVEGPENVAQVFLPPLAPIVSDALQRVSGSPLAFEVEDGRVSTLLVRHWLIGHPDGGPLPSSSGVAGRPMAIISASGSLSPAYISVPIVSGGRLRG